MGRMKELFMEQQQRLADNSTYGAYGSIPEPAPVRVQLPPTHYAHYLDLAGTDFLVEGSSKEDVLAQIKIATAGNMPLRIIHFTHETILL